MRELRNWIDGELTGYTFTPDELRARDEAIIDATWHFMDVAECWPDLETSEIDAIIAAAEQGEQQ